MSEPLSAPPTRAQAFLGWFVVWQIGYLLVASLLSLVPRPGGDDQSFNPTEALRAASRGYAAATLQAQAWSLFPEFPGHSTFVAAQLLDEQGRPLELVSDFEPADPEHFVDPTFYRDRLWNNEAHLSLLYLPWTDATLAQEPPEYQQYRLMRVQRYGLPALAFLRWKINEYERLHPGSKPAAAVLEARVYATPAPLAGLWTYLGPYSRPLVRWRQGTSALEVYNPHTGRFDEVVPLP